MRVHPHRPNPPGPNNPIGPNNPAISNSLSTLNPTTPFSNNQIVLRQLMLPMQQNALPSAASPSARNTLYSYIPNATLGGATHQPGVPESDQLLMHNRSVYTVSHPLVMEQPDPMTPFTNNYMIINGRYFAINHNPANDVSMHASRADTGATLFNGSQMIYIGLGQDLRFAIQEGVNTLKSLQIEDVKLK